ncbi:MAG: type II toxin-antitoxin system death-on-curing family toxin [Hydrotalea sp.]|nr:type II toxin-antitoxin system death-on-curing family toxin [Hydrotalea sp.]
MISIKEVEEIHQALINTFGGSHGIRDVSVLESALARPFQCFYNKELHPTPIHKAASLIESILMNHPFIDGNKRTGYVLMRILLINNGLDISASLDEKYKFVISIASGQSKFEQIVAWLNNHVVKTDD